MRLPSRIRDVVASVAAATLLAPAVAEAASDVFQGKGLKLIVGMPPGGGVDAYARLLQRHMTQHLTGKPSIVVQHMPGAGSLRAVQYMATAPNDATTIVTFTSTLIVDSVLSPEQSKVNLREFSFIGNASEDTRVCYVRAGIGTGNIAELRKREIIFGVTTASQPEASMIRNLLGLNMRLVRGYAGSADKRLALEKAEIDGDCAGWTSLPLDWKTGGKVINVFVRVSPALLPGMDPAIPYGGDVLASAEDRRLFEFLTAPTRLGRPFMVKRNSPPEQIAALRAAFDAAVKDPELLAEAAKMEMTISPISGPEVDRQIGELYDAPPELVARAKTITAQ